jgi:hypothetical protein
MRAHRPSPSGQRSEANTGPNADASAEQDDSLTEEFRRTMGVMAPWATSFLCHLGVVVLALLLVWMVYEPDPDRDIPIGVHDTTVKVLNLDSSTESKSLEDSGVEAAVEPTAPQEEDIPTPPSDLTNADIGAAPARRAGSPFMGLPVSGGHGTGLFGIGSGSGGPCCGEGDKIIFLIDASGSLVESMPYVLQELKRSIQNLPSGKQFNVIFFEGGKAKEVPAPQRGWKTSAPNTCRQVADWLDSGHITPRGRTDPRLAIQLALNYQPQVLVILSDNITGAGRHEINRAQLLDFFESAAGPKPVVHTIQFITPDRTGTLQELATRFGGSHKFIDENDLGGVR